MSLTSTALVEGGTFLAANTCAGSNVSPPLSWTTGPAGTMSYAVVLTDLTLAVTQWVVWDIPPATTSLPPALPGDAVLTSPPGAKQVHRIDVFGAGAAYRGPCPNGAAHVYQFEVDAIFSADLSGVSTGSAADSVKAAVQAASLAHADLLGSSSASAPATDARDAPSQ